MKPTIENGSSKIAILDPLSSIIDYSYAAAYSERVAPHAHIDHHT